MPLQDPHLYGQPRPKRQKKELAVPGSLDFTSQMSSLLAASSSNASVGTYSNGTTTARPRAVKSKSTDALAGVKVKRKDRASTETKDGNKLNLKSPIGTEESKAEREFIRRKLESKARLYAAMQRGDYIGREMGLVDFDRKWAESQESGAGAVSSSDSDSASEHDDDNVDTTLVEYTDEFGRVRQVTRAQKLRLERRAARGLASAAELEHMSARPKAPSSLIYGDAVQAEAFVARDGLETMEALARKRDRSPTPPEAVHYQADKEIRTRGVGFYQFSKEEAKRAEEMAALEKERERTESVRREREELVQKRKREIEERRKKIEESRAKKRADSFLEALGRDLGPGGADGGGTGAADTAEGEKEEKDQ
ncbi:hypothetical protein VTK26DRAFT_265 [Humicola hyalothermophila]